MALDSVPPYPSDLGSSRAAAAARTQQRIRKEERTWTSDTYAPYDDGHQWRKYGEKKLSNSHFPRFYYRCTYKNDMKCPATKQVQQKDTGDPPLFSVTYFNQHTCSSTSSSAAVGSARDIASQSPSKKAVSICFSPHAAASEQTSFMTTTTVAPPVMRSYGANRQPDRSAYSQQPDRGAYARQPQWWTGGVPSPASNGPAKMEVAESAQQPSASYGSAGAPSRTLLPIGQSRCIEYFHFL